MKTRKIIFGLGIGLTCFSLGVFLIFFLDILLFPFQPWPYVDGGGWEYILLHKSLFWEQYLQHCQFLDPTFLGLLIWKYWIIPFTIGLSLILNAANELQLENSEFYKIIDKTIPYSSVGVFFLNSLLYFVYALRFEKTFSSESPYFVLLDPFRLVILLPVMTILPMIVNYLLYKGLNSSRRIYLIIVVFLVAFDLFITLFTFAIALWGCI